MASASMDPEPVIIAAIVLVIAIPRLAVKAKVMDFVDSF
jgi:hypothetical protein